MLTRPSLPKALQTGQLEEVTAQPLLNYLLALSYRRGQLDFSLSPSLNEIYRDLLDAVYERPWGEGDHPAKRQLRKEEFNDLLDELGLAAWHGEGRTVTEVTLIEACARAGLSEQLERFKEGAKAGAIGLLAAFYFREAGKLPGGERTFEFTHKSFGEYLAARRVVRWMEDIHEDRVLNRKNRQRGKTEEQALAAWIEVTGPTALDHYLLAFLEREVAIREGDIVEEWQKTFVELLNDQLRHGLPMHKLGLSSFHEMARQARNAEEALLAVLHGCAERSKSLSQIDWYTAESFSLMIRILQSIGASRKQLVMMCLANLKIDNQNCVFLDLHNANFASSSLQRAGLGGAILYSANLARANMTEANLFWAKLHIANLEGANLKNANLEQADLEWANLDGANLEGANLDGADLRKANLAEVRDLDKARGLSAVRSWKDAKVGRKWVERLGLDAEKLGLKVVDDVEDDSDDDLDDDQPAEE